MSRSLRERPECTSYARCFFLLERCVFDVPDELINSGHLRALMNLIVGELETFFGVEWRKR